MRRRGKMLPNDGKLVKSIWWQGPEGGNAQSRKNMQLIYHNEYMGDRTDEWILRVENGIETARYNVKYIETIIWEEATDE
jgi:hypothetical protein